MRLTNPTLLEYRLLPILDDGGTVFKASHGTCDAVCQIVDDEVRIPYVARDERGDFKALMDELVRELDGHTKFRFVAIEHDSLFNRALKIIQPDDARTLEEAVNGFEKETLREYRNSDGRIEPVETLIGHWNLEDGE